MLRIALFLATNVAIMVVLSIVCSILGVDRYLDASGGINFASLLLMSAIFGMSGSLISLALSKTMAKRGMGVKVIEQPQNPTERWIFETVRRQAEATGVGMPEVGIFNSEAPNAFATGMNRDNALVAVSTGLLQSMRKEEVEAVLGHEMAHVANGDMVTLALIQGVVNTFVFFLSRVIGVLVDRAVFKVERGHGPGFFITVIIAQIVLGILASIIVMWFSRRREFRADAGGAKLTSAAQMAGALKALKRASGEPLPDEMAAFGISGGKMGGLSKLFMTHPPLDARIAALESER